MRMDRLRPGGASSGRVRVGATLVLLTVVALAAYWIGRRSGPASRPEPADSPAAAEPSTRTEASTAPVTATSQATREEHDVFTVSVPTPPPAAVPTEAPPAEAEKKPETLQEQMARCLRFSVSKDTAFSVTNGVRVRVEARNICAIVFAGAEVWVEVRAIAGNGTAGRATGHFQTTIPALGTAETLLTVPCDPDKTYRFEAAVAE